MLLPLWCWRQVELAQIFKAKGRGRQRKGPNQAKTKVVTTEVTGLDHQCQGVCGNHEPIIFVDGGLPGEKVRVAVHEQKKRFWRGRVTEVLEPDPARIPAFCPHFDACGGCQTQHLAPESMLVHKQAAVDALLRRNGLTEGFEWALPLRTTVRGYRRKTRLALDARHPDKISLGFREKQGAKVINIGSCGILVEALEALIGPLQQLMTQLEQPQAIGHVGLIKGDNLVQVCFRVTRTLSDFDHNALTEFAQLTDCQLVLEGKDQANTLISKVDQTLFVQPEEGIKLELTPNDFVQVNDGINQAMVAQAIEWLDLQTEDQVLDLFCGVGNFSLPFAKRCQQVVGIEGVAKMVQRAEHNALINGVGNARFLQADLSDPDPLTGPIGQNCTKILLDPARDGAATLVPNLAQTQAEKVLYVSCNPATFARDAVEMVKGPFRLDRIGLMDMFPNTSHTELMALFVRHPE